MVRKLTYSRNCDFAAFLKALHTWRNLSALLLLSEENLLLNILYSSRPVGMDASYCSSHLSREEGTRRVEAAERRPFPLFCLAVSL